MRARTRIRADMINTTRHPDIYTRVGRDTDRAVKYTVESVACSNTTVAEPRAGIYSRGSRYSIGDDDPSTLTSTLTGTCSRHQASRGLDNLRRLRCDDIE